MVKAGRRFASGFLAAMLAALVCSPVGAETASGTMTVSATVEESCHIDARPLVFGTLRGDQGRVEAQSTLLLACTPATGYAIGIDDGRNAANGIRRMADATGMNFLAYELFSDSARHRRWTGDGTVSAVAPANGHVELTVYAHVETGRAAAGTYGDVLTITVSF